MKKNAMQITNNQLIKFRSFIGGKMVYWGFIDGVFISPPVSNGQNAFNTPQMRFTGLKKKGVEVYEGDIFKQTFHDEGERIVFYSVVQWDNSSGCFFISEEKEGENDYFSEIVKDSPIVGNVWENPELLTL